MPVTPSSNPAGNLPINLQPVEQPDQAAQRLHAAPAQEQIHPVIRNAREIIARDSGSKARLIQSYLQFGTDAQGAGALPYALREMTNAIFQGEPVDAEEFAAILKKIDQSEEKDIPAFLEKIRNDIYPKFSEKYGKALHASHSSTAPIGVRIQQSRDAVKQARVQLAESGGSTSQLMGQASRAMHLAGMLREQLSLAGTDQVISSLQSRHAAVNQQYMQIHVMDMLATGLLSLSQGRGAQKAVRVEVGAWEYGLGKKWQGQNPQQCLAATTKLTAMVGEGRAKLHEAIQKFTLILNKGQSLAMDTELFDHPFGMYKYSERVTKPIQTNRSLMGMAAVTLADALDSLNSMLMDDYQFSFNLNYRKALQSAFDIDAKNPCTINAGEITARRDAMAKLQQPAMHLCVMLDATIARVKENLPLLAQQGLTAEKNEVQAELLTLTDSLQYAASDQMQHHLHKLAEAIWYGVPETLVPHQSIDALTNCKKLAHGMRDICSVLGILTDEGEANADHHVKRVPAQLRAAVLHGLSESISELPAQVAALHVSVNNMEIPGIHAQMLAWTKQAVGMSLSHLHQLLNSARTGLQMKIDTLPKKDQLASSQSAVVRREARNFIQGHFVSYYDKIMLARQDAARREKIAAELIASAIQEPAGPTPASSSKKKKNKGKGNAKAAPAANASASTSAPLPMRTNPLKLFQDAHAQLQQDAKAIDADIERELLVLAEAETGSNIYSSTAIANAGEWAVARLSKKLEQNRQVVQLSGNIQGPDRARIESVRTQLTTESKAIRRQIDTVEKDVKRLAERKLRDECLSTREFDKVVKLLELKQIEPLANRPDLHRQNYRVTRDVEGNPLRNPDNTFVLEERPTHMRGWVMGYPLQVTDEPDNPDAPHDRKIVIHIHYDPQTHLIGSCSLKSWDERNWSVNPVTGQPVTRQPLSDSQRDQIVPLLDARSSAPFGWKSLFPAKLTPAMIAHVPAAVVGNR